eukprot:107374-Rhodomonas_salina.1
MKPAPDTAHRTLSANSRNLKVLAALRYLLSSLLLPGLLLQSSPPHPPPLAVLEHKGPGFSTVTE